MKVLVSGGAGFIGSHLVDVLLAAGHQVRVLDDFSTGKRTNLPMEAGQLEVVEGSVTDAQACRRAMAGVDAVAHLAAIASVQASVEHPVKTHEVNFRGTLNLLEAMREQRCRRILFASSAAVYGNEAEPPVSEQTLVDPLTPYAADKLASEHYIRFFAEEFGLQASIFRFFNIYGPRQDPGSPYSGVISIFHQRLVSGQPICIYGDGEQTRDFVYVHDLVLILHAALQSEQGTLQAVNVGTGKSVSINELLEVAALVAGRKADVRYEAGRAGEVRDSCAAITRLSEQFPGLEPQTSLEQGLRVLFGS